MKYSARQPNLIRRLFSSVRPPSTKWRKLRASWRDTLLLLREFSWPLLFFTLAMLGGGLLYYLLAAKAHQPIGSRTEAVYLVLSLTFLQAFGEFPQVWYLQILYFLMPIIGIGILAQGLTDFGVMLFNRHARSKEWEMAIASTYSNHVILIGLGHLGFRVLMQMLNMGQDIVVIEQNPKAELLDQARVFDVPVLQEDGKREEALQAAGVSKARTIVVCTQNDSMNLQIAFRARRLNPSISVVLRIFDSEFAEALETHFGFRAMSATGMSAPLFAAAAAGVDITPPITVEGEALSLASLGIQAESRLVGKSVAEIEQTYNVSVVLHRRNHASDFHPAGDRCFSADDVLAVLGGPQEISQLANDNQN